MRVFALVVALIAALAKPASAEELLVAAAVSLREPLEAVAKGFEATHPGVHVQLAFGATSALAAQAKAGAPLDVFVSADEETIALLAKQGLLRTGSERVIAGNQLVVIVAVDVEGALASASDLARPEIRHVALPEPAVPLGRYARAWLAEQGLLEKLKARIVPTEHARATLAAVDAGNAQAGIVYATDARMARSARVAFTPPAAQQPRIVYVAARMDAAPKPALADAFLATLSGVDGRSALVAAGFAPPPGIASR